MEKNTTLFELELSERMLFNVPARTYIDQKTAKNESDFHNTVIDIALNIEDDCYLIVFDYLFDQKESEAYTEINVTEVLRQRHLEAVALDAKNCTLTQSNDLLSSVTSSSNSENSDSIEIISLSKNEILDTNDDPICVETKSADEDNTNYMNFNLPLFAYSVSSSSSSSSSSDSQQLDSSDDLQMDNKNGEKRKISHVEDDNQDRQQNNTRVKYEKI